MKNISKLLIIILVATPFCLGQSHRIDEVLNCPSGQPYPTIRVCTEPASGTPCTPLATIYSDPGLSVPLGNPFTGDACGNYGYFAVAGNYHEQISGTSFNTYDNSYVPMWPTTGGLTLETNGTLNGSQSLLNFVNSGTCTWSNSGGQEQVSCSGSGSGMTCANGETCSNPFIAEFASSSTLENGPSQFGTVNNFPAILLNPTGIGNGGTTPTDAYLATAAGNSRTIIIGSTDTTCCTGSVLIVASAYTPGLAGHSMLLQSIGGTNADAYLIIPFGAFADLSSITNAGAVVYCHDCNIATPCTGSGSGAWAFYSGHGGTTEWVCPF